MSQWVSSTQGQILETKEAAVLLRRRRPTSDKLLVSEIFGPTVQGEGLHAGQAASFLRLGACSLECSWCDTTYAWQPHLVGPKNTFELASVDSVAQQILDIGVGRLIVSGGEPTLQRASIAKLARRLAEQNVLTEIETAGVRNPGELLSSIELFTVSPKLSNSGMPVTRRLRWSVLEKYAAAPSVFKFVVTSSQDLEEVDEIVRRLAIAARRVFVSAEGTAAASQLSRSRAIATDVLGRGWGLSPRWHLYLWGDQRGR